MQFVYGTLLSAYLLVSVIVDFMLIWFCVTVIVSFRPSCICCIFSYFYLFFTFCILGFYTFLSLFCCFMVDSSMGLYVSGNREINMMMMMMMMSVGRHGNDRCSC